MEAKKSRGRMTRDEIERRLAGLSAEQQARAAILAARAVRGEWDRRTERWLSDEDRSRAAARAAAVAWAAEATSEAARETRAAAMASARAAAARTAARALSYASGAGVDVAAILDEVGGAA